MFPIEKAMDDQEALDDQGILFYVIPSVSSTIFGQPVKDHLAIMPKTL